MFKKYPFLPVRCSTQKGILVGDHYYLSSLNREAFGNQQEWLLYEHVVMQRSYIKDFLSRYTDDDQLQSNNQEGKIRPFLAASYHTGNSLLNA